MTLLVEKKKKKKRKNGALLHLLLHFKQAVGPESHHYSQAGKTVYLKNAFKVK